MHKDSKKKKLFLFFFVLSVQIKFLKKKILSFLHFSISNYFMCFPQEVASPIEDSQYLFTCLDSTGSDMFQFLFFLLFTLFLAFCDLPPASFIAVFGHFFWELPFLPRLHKCGFFKKYFSVKSNPLFWVSKNEIIITSSTFKDNNLKGSLYFCCPNIIPCKSLTPLKVTKPLSFQLSVRIWDISWNDLSTSSMSVSLPQIFFLDLCMFFLSILSS